MIGCMDEKHTSFPRTTASQRRLLFETWTATQDVEAACRTAHVCRQTFYNWKPRFVAGGAAALETFDSFAPKQPHCTAPDVVARVLAARRDHPTWGKTRIADELAKANQWVPLVSPNTVRRILADAGLWPESPAKKGAPRP